MTKADSQALLACFIAQIQKARSDQVLSQAKHARRADTDPGTVNKFLAGADVRVTTFFRLCEAAGLEVTLHPKELRKTA